MAAQILTDSMIRGLEIPLPGERMEFSDVKSPGLVVRITPNGIRSFSYRYRDPKSGKVTRLTLGSYPEVSLADARQRSADARKAVRNGESPQAQKITAREAAKSALTFDQAAQAYIDQYAKPNKSSWRNDESYLKRPRAKWRSKPVSAVTDDDVAQLLAEIEKEAPVTANRTRSVLHKSFRWFKEPGRKWVAANPCADLPRRAKETPRDRVLTDAEIKGLWRGLFAPDAPREVNVRLATALVLVTGQRPGEVAGMQRSELSDLDSEAQWHLPGERTKNRLPHIVPLSDLAVAIIRAAIEIGKRKNKECAVIFPSKWDRTEPIDRHSLSQALPAVRKYAKLKEHFTTHDLRRTFTTLGRRSKISRDIFDALLNHKVQSVTARHYDKYEMLEEKTEAMRIIADRLNKIIGKASAGPKGLIPKAKGRPKLSAAELRGDAADWHEGKSRDIEMAMKKGTARALLSATQRERRREKLYQERKPNPFAST